MDFAFRQRYRLAPTDPRYLDATDEDIVLDYHAGRFWDDPKLESEEVENPEYAEELDRMAGGEGTEGEGMGEEFADEIAEMERRIRDAEAKRQAKLAAGEGDPDAPAPPPAPGGDWETVAEERFGQS